MSLDPNPISQRLMLAFDGAEPPDHILRWIRERNPAGFTLFRPKNVVNPGQVRALTGALQDAAAVSGPLLIATDQEGGQFVALGEGTTHFPGNMALGAAGDSALARRVGKAMGLEMAALGVNVNYGPVCDVNTNPDNPNVGTRAFGDDAAMVAELGAAMIEGQQVAGVAATAKHFPGNGDSALDPHYGVPVLPHDAKRLEEVDFRPFRAAVVVGSRLMMTAHVALPALTGQADLPATLSETIMDGYLRRQLGYDGLLITDALDMHAITQGAGQIIDIIAALRAGVDLLLMTGDPEVQERVYAGLKLAYSRGLLPQEKLLASQRRLNELRAWLATQLQPDLEVVGCREHQQLAEAVARRATTLVRDQAGLLPLRMEAGQRIAAIMPVPRDLTPADTSSMVIPGLAQAIRAYHPQVDEIIVKQQPSASEIPILREKASEYNLLIIGTISAHLQPAQADLVNALLDLDIPTVTVAMRTPYDLGVYPRSQTHICTYSIQPVSMKALAAALWAQTPFSGRLPVNIAGIYKRGHGIGETT